MIGLKGSAELALGMCHEPYESLKEFHWLSQKRSSETLADILDVFYHIKVPLVSVSVLHLTLDVFLKGRTKQYSEQKCFPVRQKFIYQSGYSNSNSSYELVPREIL